MSRGGLLTIAGGVAIVVLSFSIVTLVLNWLAPIPEDPSATQVQGGENLLASIQDFADPPWSTVRIVPIVPAPATAPNGKDSAFRLVETKDAGRHYIDTNLTGARPGAVYTFSIYFKPVERSSIFLEMGDNPPGEYGSAICNSAHGDTKYNATKDGKVVDAVTEDLSNGWYRCWAAMTFRLSTVVLGINLLGADGAQDYQGDGHSRLLVWQPQFELGNRPTGSADNARGN